MFCFITSTKVDVISHNNVHVMTLEQTIKIKIL